MSFKALLGRKVSTTVPFCGGEAKISKLSVAQVADLQELSKKIGADVGEEAVEGSENIDSQLKVLHHVIAASVEGAADMTIEEMKQAPLDELNQLSSAILKHSGLGSDESTEKPSAEAVAAREETQGN